MSEIGVYHTVDFETTDQSRVLTSMAGMHSAFTWRHLSMSASHHGQSDEPISSYGLPVLYNLVYCSRAADGVDDAAVAQIIECSRRNNPRKGITGLLVFGSGIFFQWLEGPRDNVLELLSKLVNDSRHDSVVRLSETEEVRERVFPDWDMELVSTTDIREVLLDALGTAEAEQNAEALRLMLAQLDSGQLSGLEQSGSN